MLYRRKLALAFMALAIGVSGTATGILYALARHYLVGEIESKAMSIAATASALVDADLQAKLARGDAAPDAEVPLKRALAAVRDANRRRDVHAFFVYTAVHRPGGGLRTVVDDESGRALGSRGDLAENDRIPVGTTGVEDLKSDEFGTWISGYAPIRDANGHVVGTLVVDIAATDLLGRMRLLLGSGLGAIGAALLLALGLSLPLSRRVTRPLETTVAAVNRIAAGDLETRVDASRADEFGRLADALDSMLPKLRDHLRLRDSVHLAKEVQRNLLPTTWPSVASFDIAATSAYCDEIGGDYYDLLDLSSNGEPRLGIVVADVAGHGVAAALLMATTRAILRSRIRPGDSLAAAIGEANRSIVADRFSDRFVTLIAVVIDTGDLRLRWVSAGHEPAILYDPATDSFEELGGRDIPLGVRPDWEYHEHAREGWRHGQVILIGTDGIWETRDRDGNRFGKDALREIVRANADRPPREIEDATLAALTRFRGGRTQEDDVTLVVLKA